MRVFNTLYDVDTAISYLAYSKNSGRLGVYLSTRRFTPEGIAALQMMGIDEDEHWHRLLNYEQLKFLLALENDDV